MMTSFGTNMGRNAVIALPDVACRVLPRVTEPVDCGLDADPDIGTPEGAPVDILVALVQAYEAEQVSITVPDQDLLR